MIDTCSVFIRSFRTALSGRTSREIQLFFQHSTEGQNFLSLLHASNARARERERERERERGGSHGGMPLQGQPILTRAPYARQRERN